MTCAPSADRQRDGGWRFADSPDCALENAFVRLEPLGIRHAGALAGLAVGTGLTRWFPEPLETSAAVDRFIAKALDDAASGLARPFAIVDPATGAVAGSTRFGAMAPEHRRVEIGWTFVGEPWRRTAINTAAKLLLLTEAFERLRCIRVELKTDARNLVSRAAIARLGAIEEGVLRSHIICADGYRRDTVYFSIVAPEWPAVKARLSARLTGRLGPA
jgi:RimJ/RimL family protein N-acetyltransferase